MPRIKLLCKARGRAMMMYGYRPDTNRPGHHMTVVQSLPLTIGLESARVAVLDVLRRQRNVAGSLATDSRPQERRQNQRQMQRKSCYDLTI